MSGLGERAAVHLLGQAVGQAMQLDDGDLVRELLKRAEVADTVAKRLLELVELAAGSVAHGERRHAQIQRIERLL